MVDIDFQKAVKGFEKFVSEDKKRQVVVEKTRESQKRKTKKSFSKPRYVDVPQPGIKPLEGTETLTKEEFYEDIGTAFKEERDVLKGYKNRLIGMQKGIVDTGLYDDPRTEVVERYPGTYVKLLYSKEIMDVDKAIEESYWKQHHLSELGIPKLMPYHRLRRDTETGVFSIGVDVQAKRDYEFQQQDPVTQFGRTAISTLLYSPKYVLDFVIGGATLGYPEEKL